MDTLRRLEGQWKSNMYPEGMVGGVARLAQGFGKSVLQMEFDGMYRRGTVSQMEHPSDTLPSKLELMFEGAITNFHFHEDTPHRLRGTYTMSNPKDKGTFDLKRT
jgi:hypothetical protein